MQRSSCHAMEKQSQIQSIKEKNMNIYLPGIPDVRVGMKELHAVCTFDSLLALDNERDFVKEATLLYGGKSFSNLIEMGLVCMIKQYMKREWDKREGVMENIFLLISILLPELPDEFEINSLMEITVHDSAEEFAGRIFNEMFSLLNDNGGKINDMSGSVNFQTALPKTLYFAPLEMLTGTLFEGLGLLGKIFCHPKCVTLNRVYVMILAIIDLRFPEAMKKDLISIDKILMLRRISDVSPLSVKLYEKYEMENALKDASPNWNQILEISQSFDKGDFDKAFEALLVFSNQKVTEEIVESDLIPCLRHFISNSFDDENFMKSFIQIIVGQPGESWKVDNFRRFVGMIKQSIVLIHCEWTSSSKQNCDYSRHYYENLLLNAALLLWDLYAVNSVLNQYLDNFATEPPLDKSEFHCVMTWSEFRLRLPTETEESLLLYKNLACVCAVMFPLEIRRYLFKKFVQDSYYSNTNFGVGILLKRTNVLERMFSIINPGLSSPKFISMPWTIAFEGEIGRGYGLNKELFTLISRGFQRHDLNLWYGEPVNGDIMTQNEDGKPPQSYTFSPNGLFPKATGRNRKPIFLLLGQLLAKAIIDCHLLDIPLSVEFFKYVTSRDSLVYVSLCHDVAKVVPDTSKLIMQLLSVRSKKWDIEDDHSLTEEEKFNLIKDLMFDDDCSFEDLSVNFTMPGSGEELIEGGKDVMLDPFNTEQYLRCISDFVLVQNFANLDAIRDGIEDVISLHELNIFLPDELQSILCGQEYRPWSVEYLKSCCKFASGYDVNSKPVTFLFEVLSTLDALEQRQFLQFVTSRPNLPIGGLKSLSPLLTISKISTEEGKEDLRLPSASTCYNVLRLPEYSSLEKTRENLRSAISEGDGSFQYV